jgi:hypothetical protein
VLKNRLLDLTDRRFDERAFGAATIAAFVASMPDILRLDPSVIPSEVELLDAPDMPSRSTGPTAPRTRIRSDLWQAVMDYSGGDYVWDKSRARAVRREQADEGLPFPTIAETDLDDWRAAFVREAEASGNMSAAEHDSVERWRANRLSTQLLPTHLQGRWNRFMRERATERLTRWFESQVLPVPLDLLVAVDGAIGLITPTMDERDVRRLIINAVQMMTEEELASIHLPAGVVARLLAKSPDRRR